MPASTLLFTTGWLWRTVPTWSNSERLSPNGSEWIKTSSLFHSWMVRNVSLNKRYHAQNQFGLPSFDATNPGNGISPLRADQSPPRYRYVGQSSARLSRGHGRCSLRLPGKTMEDVRKGDRLAPYSRQRC